MRYALALALLCALTPAASAQTVSGCVPAPFQSEAEFNEFVRDAGDAFAERDSLRAQNHRQRTALHTAAERFRAVQDSAAALRAYHAESTLLLSQERAACDRARESAEARLRETESALRRQRVKTLAAVPVTAALVYTACRLVGC